ncbi:hypothetical protein JR316_0013259 [Psilocybe cubensis]|uniref:Uncharacterized protein n=2 Tax=Psilocybe cubensis TaxID=181762 RepID=A0ACB8GH27_PSICU|nr:hypothetical protein JR316_0013259 [Psilocybe cubensis]KAH9474794.1 hypothetical protein JR316_0013259 [Psilocybe cubensis]
MSSASPNRLRTKTSDLTDFFRGAGNSVAQPRSSQSQKDLSSTHLEVPSGDEASKKKTTRIPLFGRSRKKSTQSTASSPFASTSGVRESTDTGVHLGRASSSSALDRHPSEAPAHSTTIPPPLPVPSKPLSRVPTSLSSKFAATFSHSRSSKAAGVSSQTELRSKPPVSYPSGRVQPENNVRSVSQGESGSGSSVDKKVPTSATRPARPTITVSLSEDDDEEFKDLFTRSTEELEEYYKALELAKQQQRQSEDSHKMSARSSSSLGSPVEMSSSPSIYKRGYTPASAIAAAVRHQHVPSVESDRPSSTSSKNSRKNSDSDKSLDKVDRTSTPRPPESQESPRLTSADKDRILPPSLSRRSTMAVGSIAYHSDGSVRSRMKLGATQSRSKPPTIPLPLLPPSSPPPSSPLPPSPTIPPNIPESATVQSESGTSRKVYVRPRAHTISSSTTSIPPSPLSQSTTTKADDNIPPSTVTISPPPAEEETLDIDTASAEQLRQALRTRNEQYAEVTALVVKLTEQHHAEIAVLEKKIATLEKEARKRDTQIKGFTWMLNDAESQQQPKPLPPGILNQSRFAPSAANVVSSDSEYEIHRIHPNTHRRLVYQSDSGADSHATSGAEGGSATESISSAFRVRKLRRPYPVGDGTQAASITRSGTLRSPKLPPAANSEKALPEMPYMPTSMAMATKRSSVSSTTVSPSSSTSSLLPPSPSITVSSLSAIPEGSKPLGILHTTTRYDSSSEQQDERRAARASHRTSLSSLTSSSTAASSSYSANIKRSRPPSIAQVLEKSPSNMSEVLYLKK